MEALAAGPEAGGGAAAADENVTGELILDGVDFGEVRRRASPHPHANAQRLASDSLSAAPLADSAALLTHYTLPPSRMQLLDGMEEEQLLEVCDDEGLERPVPKQGEDFSHTIRQAMRGFFIGQGATTTENSTPGGRSVDLVMREIEGSALEWSGEVTFRQLLSWIRALRGNRRVPDDMLQRAQVRGCFSVFLLQFVYNTQCTLSPFTILAHSVCFTGVVSQA